MPGLAGASSSGCSSASKSEYSDEKLRGALPRLARASIDDVMAAVGRGEMKAADVARAMYPDYKEERAAARAAQPAKSESGWFGLKRAKSLKFKVPSEGDAAPDPRHQQRPAGALRAERRRGAGRPHRRDSDAGQGITIYPIQSPALKDFEETPERWLDVRWDMDDESPQRFPARLQVQSVNEPGTLAQIAQMIAEHDGNIDNIRMTRRSPDFTELHDRSRGL